MENILDDEAELDALDSQIKELREKQTEHPFKKLVLTVHNNFCKNWEDYKSCMWVTELSQNEYDDEAYDDYEGGEECDYDDWKKKTRVVVKVVEGYGASNPGKKTKKSPKVDKRKNRRLDLLD